MSKVTSTLDPRTGATEISCARVMQCCADTLVVINQNPDLIPQQSLRLSDRVRALAGHYRLVHGATTRNEIACRLLLARAERLGRYGARPDKESPLEVRRFLGNTAMEILWIITQMGEAI